MNTTKTNTSGTLSIVATPIGNMEDITLRALRVLREADAIYAEDTRVISKLLARYEIATSVHRLDAATEGKKAVEIIGRLERGERVAFVTDAGTPGISDPGARLVARVRWALMGGTEDSFFSLPPVVRVEKKESSVPPQIKIEAIPGPSALTAALSIAGIDAAQFLFMGFLPHKKGRRTALQEIGLSDYTIVLYESPHRIIKLLHELAEHAPRKRVTIARELTKLHEEVIAGTPEEIIASLESRDAARGEFVVIVECARH